MNLLAKISDGIKANLEETRSQWKVDDLIEVEFGSEFLVKIEKFIE
jgi:hypothetical protein